MKTKLDSNPRPARPGVAVREYLNVLAALAAWPYRAPYPWEFALVNRHLRPTEPTTKWPACNQPADAGCVGSAALCACAAG